ncbi:MAG: ATP-binding protein [Actinomycetota bacterium]
MLTPLGTDSVRLTVPARPEFVHVLRSVTAAVASRVPLSLDDVDDLRLAVDEACARLLALRGEAKSIRLDLRSLTDRFEVVVAVDAPTPSWPPQVLEETLAWRVLSALAESVRFELWNGAPAIRIVKRAIVRNGR